MRAHQKTFARIMLLVVAVVLCGLPEYAQAAVPQTGQQEQQNQRSGTTVDPSKGPLQPIPNQNQPSPQNPSPNPESSTEALPATPAPQPRPEQQMQEPLGTATAEGVPTVGGAASRPSRRSDCACQAESAAILVVEGGTDRGKWRRGRNGLWDIQRHAEQAEIAVSYEPRATSCCLRGNTWQEGDKSESSKLAVRGS